jgi:hypothetical protein
MVGSRKMAYLGEKWPDIIHFSANRKEDVGQN